MKTLSFTSDTVERAWHLIDCSGKPLGRVATRIADLLRGKHKPQFTPHADAGDFVVAVNVEKIGLTGQKSTQKRYWRHSGYMGGIKSRSAKEQQAIKPEELLRAAVKGMLPKSTLGRHQLGKLKVYRGTDHPHQAQFVTPAAA